MKRVLGVRKDALITREKIIKFMGKIYLKANEKSGVARQMSKNNLS
jgi:hypothetical protein